MYCSSISEIGGWWGWWCFILTSVSTSLFITSLGRLGLKIYVSGAGSTCGSEKGQQGQTFHKGVCKRRGQETIALGVLFA